MEVRDQCKYTDRSLLEAMKEISRNGPILDIGMADSFKCGPRGHEVIFRTHCLEPKEIQTLRCKGQKIYFRFRCRHFLAAIEETRLTEDNKQATCLIKLVEGE